ncbi:histone H4 transcription factor [Brachionus plicatilis]|uniref:Histone H4 transcription factor n=1 Tax=Brachionus plicatilis TaxID=10195 RepID=A0A3M7RFZ1_BRAPC|nr:histone H4 transcription factor [Brachionus plicatilis]
MKKNSNVPNVPTGNCKTHYDLQKHINLKHIERFEYECNECVYRSKDLDRIRKHMLKHHLNNIDLEKNFGTMYMCHVCKKTYSQGSTLSKHLKSVHNFQWPSGHSRFQYKLETDGFYRLQTLRYESPKLVKELNRTKDLEKLANSKIPDLPVNYESFDSSLISSIGTSSTSEYSSSNTVYDMTNQHLQLALPINLESIEPDSADDNFLLNKKNEEIQKMEVECESEKNYFVLVNTDMSQNLESQAERVEFDIENFLESNFRVKEKFFRENEISIFNSVEDPNESLDYKNIDLIQACSSKLS